ncbi:C-type lectin domain family 4 member M-like isoform X1 [Anguilla anguilla]|uniref:C-type lectin domain family 4 member M-like isoform X1 n=1 Tax=Anguilla anguilla TaxID=7936 RepID=UPI0015A921C9|nr:C-type lectin domain family 4 member M-like isoform X1 [Anguilla anguilla]
MEENYSHTEIILSDLDHKNEEFFSETPSWAREKSTIVTHRMTRLLLAVLCLILLCGLTALGVLYVEKSNMLGSLKAQNSSASLFSLEPQMAEKHTKMSDFLKAQNRNLSASLASVLQKLAEKNSIVDSLEAQNRNITVSLSSVEQKLTKEISVANSLEDQNRNLSASLSSLQQNLAEKNSIVDSLEAQNRNITVSLSSVEQKLIKEISVSNSLEDQNRNLSASLSSLQQNLAEKNSIVDSLEAQNRNITVSLSSVEQKLTKEISVSNSLEDQNRNLSASLSSLQQNLAEAERQLHELQTNHSDLLKTLLSYKESRGYRECGSGWRKYMGQCYFFSTQKLNWMQSCDFCMSKGAKLVIIDLEQEQTFLSSIISETHWIGLSDLRTEGQWHWVDDIPLSQTKHQFWYTRPNGEHEPDNWTGGGDPTGEDCAAIGDKSGVLDKWFDASCTEQKRFVCEK